jgi:pimeloyl-ACP methyl ester carboxylesterase
MLHGWGASARVWGDTQTTLADLCTTCACDLPGFGESPARAAVPTLAALADEVIAFADALGLARFDLLGHALGAAVAACVAGHHQGRVGRLIITSLGARIFAPELTTLALSRPSFDLTMGLARPLFDLWQPINRAMMQSPPVALTLEALLLHDGPTSGGLWRGYLADHAAADARAYVTALTAVSDLALHTALRAINVPTLCIAGREDHIAHLAETTVAHTLIAESQLHILDSCGHLPMLEQPEAFHHAVREFLAG